MRFVVGPNSKQLRALRNTVCGFSLLNFRGAEVTKVASAHAGCHENAVEESPSGIRSLRRGMNLRNGNSTRMENVNQLNFECVRNKNSIAVFIIRLRRVYQA